MPSQAHEMLLLLFRNRPALAPELLREALGVELPEYSEVRLESAELNDVVPTEYRADLVVLLVNGRPVLGIVVEVQLQPDARKRFSWPVYVTGLRARLECPCCLLVVTTSESTANWAQDPIALGPGSVLVPLVIAPAGVPIVTDPERARRDPELAVLSVMAHGGGDVETAVKIAHNAFSSTATLDEDAPHYTTTSSILPSARQHERRSECFPVTTSSKGLLSRRGRPQRWRRAFSRFSKHEVWRSPMRFESASRSRQSSTSSVAGFAAPR